MNGSATSNGQKTGRLPREHEAERYCLGCMLAFPESAGEVLKRLRAADFVDLVHRDLIDIFSRQHAAGGIDRMLAARELKSHPDFIDGDPFGYLLELKDDAVTSVHLAAEANKILEARRKRQCIEFAETLLEHSQNGYTFSQFINDAWAGLDDMRREAEANEPCYRFTYADLRRLHPWLNDPVIDGLCREGETVNIIANSKVGKSWLTYYVLLCIVNGRPLFDRFHTSPGRVLLLDNELHANTLAHRVGVVADALGLSYDKYEREIEIWSLRGRLPSLPDLEHELSEFEPGYLKAIAFDAKYRFQAPGTSENDNATETQFYNLVDRIAAKTGAACFLIHHGSKGDQSGKRITDVGSGAGSQSRAADAHVILREHEQEGCMVMEAAVRSFAPIEPLALRWVFPLWVPANGIDPTKLKGGKSASEERQNKKDREGMDATIKALRPGPSTARNLRTKTGFGEYRQQRLLDQLTSCGEVTFNDTQTGGNTCRVYQLKA